MEAAASTPAPSSLLRMAIIECVLCALFLYSDLAFVVLSGNATFEEVTSERVVALAFQQGLSYGICLYASMRLLKADEIGYLNPCLTIMCMLYRPAKDSFWPAFKKSCVLIASQFIGSMIGAFLVYAFIPSPAKSNEILGIPHLSHGSTPLSAFVYEMLGSCVIAWVVLSLHKRQDTRNKGEISFYSIGAAHGSMVLIAYPFTGACMNIFRFLAPSLLMWHWNSYWWVHTFASLVGTSITGLVYWTALTNDEYFAEKY